MIISYHCQGRLGNNIFQYIAVKIVQKYVNDIYKFDKCKYEFNHREMVFSEFQYLQLYGLLKHCLTNGRIEGMLSQFTSINWFFDGFFQFDEHIRENLVFVKSLFTEDNEEKINNDFRVCDIVKKIHENKGKIKRKNTYTCALCTPLCNMQPQIWQVKLACVPVCPSTSGALHGPLA